MKNKRIISLLLFISIFFSLILFSSISIEATESYKINGKEYLSSLDLESKNIHIERYKVTKSNGEPVDSYVYWNVESYSNNGIEWVTSKGAYNEELVLSLNKSSIIGFIDLEISIVAEIDGQSIYKTLEVKNLSDDKIREFNITSFPFANALPLVEKDDNRYSVNLYLPEGVQTFKAFYKLDVLSDSFPPADITPADQQVNIEVDFTEGSSNGITVRKMYPQEATTLFKSGFLIQVDRNNLTSDRSKFTIKLSGETSNGIAFLKNINVHLSAEGHAPEDNESVFGINLSNHYIDIPNNGVNKIPFSIFNSSNDNYELHLYDNENLRYVNAFSGVSLNGNNIEVSSNAKEGLYSLIVKSTDRVLSTISSFYVKKDIVDNQNWSISLSSNIPNNSEIMIPSTGIEVVEFDHVIRQGSTIKTKEVVYKLDKNNDGLALKNGVLVIYPNASSGYYNIEVSLVDDPSTKATHTIYLAKAILPADEYRIDIAFENGENKFEIPSNGAITIPIKVIKTKNSILDNNLRHRIDLKESGQGISIQEDKLVIDSNAKSGSYQIQAVLLDDLSTKSNILYFSLSESSSDGKKSIMILADDTIIIPKNETISKAIDYKIVQNGKEIGKENVVWSIVNQKNGVFITSNGTLNIEPTANEGDIIIQAELSSDSNIKASKKISLKKEGSAEQGNIKIKGFDREYSNSGELWVSQPSGTIKRLTVHEYDDKGLEILDAEIDLNIKESVSGITLSKGNNRNEYYITLNNIVSDQIITLVAQSKTNTNKKVEITVVIKKQGDLMGILNFEEERINPNEPITVSAMVSNSGNKDATAVLILVVYDGNKMIDFREKTIVVGSTKTVIEELTVRLPREVSKVRVKAFLTEGKNALTATRNISEALEIKR